MRALCALSALAATGCTGVLFIGMQQPRDGGTTIARDGSRVEDGGTPFVDAASPLSPCAAVQCGAHANCIDGACRCDEGFVDLGGAVCNAPPPGDPATRTETEVCDRWRSGHTETAFPPWIAGASQCDVGTMRQEAIDDTLRRVNLYRWLAGLPIVGHDATQHRAMMECALMMAVNGMINHAPPPTWACYTSDGAAAAGRSNLSMGLGSSGQGIDVYMADWSVSDLGHRRWILSASLDVVEIGFAGDAQCLGVMHSGGSTDRAWTAYPNPGPAPIDTAAYSWSFQANTIDLFGDATVSVQRASDGADLPVVTSFIAGSWGRPTTIAWTPNGWTPTIGETYRVAIHGTSVGDIAYQVHLVAC